MPSLTRMTNDILRSSDERTVSDREVGARLSSLGFEGKRRTNRGWILELGYRAKKRSDQLIKIYGNRYLDDASSGFEEIFQSWRSSLESELVNVVNVE